VLSFQIPGMLLYGLKRQRVVRNVDGAKGLSGEELALVIDELRRSESSPEALLDLLCKAPSQQLLEAGTVRRLQPDLYWLLHLVGHTSFLSYLEAVRTEPAPVLSFLRARFLEPTEQDSQQYGCAVDIVKFLFNEVCSRSASASTCQKLLLDVVVPPGHFNKALQPEDLWRICIVFEHLNTMTQLRALADFQGLVLEALFSRTVALPPAKAPSPSSPSPLDQLFANLQPGVLRDSISTALRPRVVANAAPAPSPLSLSTTFQLRPASMQAQSFFGAVLELCCCCARPEATLALTASSLLTMQQLSELAREAAVAAIETGGREMLLRAVALVDHMDHIVSHAAPPLLQKAAMSAVPLSITGPWLASLLPAASSHAGAAATGAAMAAAIVPTTATEAARAAAVQALPPANNLPPRQAAWAVLALTVYVQHKGVTGATLRRVAAAIKPLLQSPQHRQHTSHGSGGGDRAGGTGTEFTDAVSSAWQIICHRDKELSQVDPVLKAGSASVGPQSAQWSGRAPVGGARGAFLQAAGASSSSSSSSSSSWLSRGVGAAPPRSGTDAVSEIEQLVLREVRHEELRVHPLLALKALEELLDWQPPSPAMAGIEVVILDGTHLDEQEGRWFAPNKTVDGLHSNMRATLHSAALTSLEAYVVAGSLLCTGLVRFVGRACMLHVAALATPQLGYQGQGQGHSHSHSQGQSPSAAAVVSRVRQVLLPVVMEGSTRGPLGSLSSGLTENVLRVVLTEDQDNGVSGADVLALILAAMRSQRLQSDGSGVMAGGSGVDWCDGDGDDLGHEACCEKIVLERLCGVARYSQSHRGGL